MAEESQNTSPLQFEDIEPWQPAATPEGSPSGDTGLSSRLKLKRNFDRIKLWATQLASTIQNFVTHQDLDEFEEEINGHIAEVIDETCTGRFLSKTDEDTAAEQIGFLKGLWVNTKNLFGIAANGTAKVYSLLVNGPWGIGNNGDATLRDASLRNMTASGNVSVTGSLTAAQLIASLLKTPEFVEAVGMIGNGFGVTVDNNGKAKLQTNDLIVLGQMIVNSLNIREVTYIGGTYLLTPAGSTVAKVLPLYGSSASDTRTWSTSSSGTVRGYRLLWKADNGTVGTMNYWQQGDQAFCQTYNVTDAGEYEDASNRRYWRLVCRVGQTTVDGIVWHYADLADSSVVYLYDKNGNPVYNEGGGTAFAGYENASGSVPDTGDKVVCLGSQTDATRRGAVQITAEGTASIGIYDGINNYAELSTHEVHYFSKEDVRMSARRFKWTTASGDSVPPTVYRGTWTQGSVSAWGDEWTYNGSNWICVYTGTTPLNITEAPGTTPAYWIENKGQKGDPGDSITKESEVAYYIKNTTGVRPAADDPSWSTTKPTLSEGEWLFTKTVITWSDGSTTLLFADERNPNNGTTPVKGVDYFDGKDAYSINVTPASIILNQNLNDASDYGLPRTFTISVVAGSTAKTFKVNTPTGTGLTVSRDNSYSRTTHVITLSGVSSSVSSSEISVTLTDIEGMTGTKTIKIPVFVNQLGSWTQTIENGVSTEVGNQIQVGLQDGGIIQTAYDAAITKSAQGLTQEFTEEVSNAVVANQNLFGFRHGCGMLNGDSPWYCVPFVQGYGVVVNRSYNDGLNTRRRCMITNLGLDGVGGDFIVTFMAKVSVLSSPSSPGKMEVRMCDVPGKVVESSKEDDSDIGGTLVSLTNEWKSVSLSFFLPDDTKYMPADENPAYDGFLVFDDKDGTITSDYASIYIRHLKVERGTVRTAFIEADEDIGYNGQGQMITSLSRSNYMNYGTAEGRSNVYYTQSTIDWNGYTSLDLLYKYSSFNLVKGRTYTLSYWAKSNVSGFRISHHLYKDGSLIITNISPTIYPASAELMKAGTVCEGVYGDGLTHVCLTNQWQQYFVHWFVADNISEASLIALRVIKDANSYTEGGTVKYRTAKVYITDVKLEEGYVMPETRYKSLVQQTARRISMMQYTGDKKVGVNLEKGKMTCIGDSFEWQNQDGEQVMGLDNQGNATFKGVIRSGGIYQNIDFYDTSNAYHQYRWTFEDGHVRENEEYVAPEEYSEHIDDGYVMINCEYIGCGLLDVVYLRNEWPAENCIYIPNPQGLAGKQMEIYKGNNTSAWKIGTDPNVANSTFFDATYRQGTITSNYIVLGATTIYVRLVSNGSVWYILERRDVYGNISQ